MLMLSDIGVTREKGLFRVPADFNELLRLVPKPEGSLNLFFHNPKRMKTFLRQHGYRPFVKAGENAA